MAEWLEKVDRKVAWSAATPYTALEGGGEFYRNQNNNKKSNEMKNKENSAKATKRE